MNAHDRVTWKGKVRSFDVTVEFLNAKKAGDSIAELTKGVKRT